LWWICSRHRWACSSAWAGEVTAACSNHMIPCMTQHKTCNECLYVVAGQRPVDQWAVWLVMMRDVTQQQKGCVFCAWSVPKVYDRYGTPLTCTRDVETWTLEDLRVPWCSQCRQCSKSRQCSAVRSSSVFEESLLGNSHGRRLVEGEVGGGR
jgi:hypothetical protein